MSNNQLNDISKTYLEAVYGGKKKEAPKDDRLVVTAADKKANTKAYQNYKAGNKAYKAADHLKDDYEFARHKASVISRGGRLEDAVESWNQKLAYREAMKDVSEKKEVNVKDTYKTVAAIVDYDRSKKGSEDATWDSEHGKKKAAKKEKDYAAWERSKMKKDDPNWKHKKYHTGMHGEEKRWQDDDGDGKWYEKSDVDGKISKREKKSKKHNCASKVKHEEFGIGNPIKGMHDLDESGKVAHYDVFFEHGIEKNVPVSSLEILEGHMHEHVIYEKKKKPSVHDDYYDPMEDPEFDPHEAEATRGQSGRGTAGKMNVRKKYPVKEEGIADILARLEKKRISKGGDPEESPLPAMRKYHADKKKKVKKESLSDWRDDLSSLIEIVAEPEEKAEKKVKEGKVNNKVVINPKISEAIQEMGGEVLEHHQVDCDDDCEPNCEHDVAEGQVKKEIKDLSTAAKTLKGKNVAKADKIEEGKNCGCGQNPCVTYGTQVEESYDEIDDDLLLFVESSLGNLPEDQILDMMESGWHRRNPGKKHPLESGSKKVTPRPVSDAEKKSTDKSDRMYVAMRRVKDRQKGYSKAKSDAADRLHGEYTARQSKRKAGASPKEAAAQSPGAFGSKGFRIKRGGRKGKAPGTDRGTGNKAARRAGQEVKDRDPRKTRKEENFFSRFRNI